MNDRKDTRIAYGAHCVWWDSIHKVGSRPFRTLYDNDSMPCCPHCKNMLFEMPHEDVWWEGVDRYEADGHPGYRAFQEWLRGKCFPTLEAAQKAYAERSNG